MDSTADTAVFDRRATSVSPPSAKTLEQDIPWKEAILILLKSSFPLAMSVCFANLGRITSFYFL